MGVLYKMDHTGDTRIEFSEEPTSLAEAQKVLDKFVAEGGMAFKTEKGSDKGEQIRKLTGTESDVVLVPKVVGG